MKGLILAGGYATRLRPLSCSKPKLLFPVVGVPLIDLMIDWLKTARVNDIVLALNHMADRVQIEIGWERHGTQIEYSIEEQPLGTGGPIRFARKRLGDEDFIVVNGDIVSNISIKEMVEVHQRSDAEATIAVVEAKDPSQYGLVRVDESGSITSFDEKNRMYTGPGLINAGVYVLSPEIIDRISDSGMVSLERQVFPGLVREGSMMAWKHRLGYWYDIGKIPDYFEVNQRLLEQSWSGRKIDSSKDPYYIGRKSIVEDGARIGPYTIISDNVAVKKGAVVNESIIFEDTIIEENCRVDRCIIGERVRLGTGVMLGRGTLVAGQISIPPGRQYAPESSILSA